MIPNAGLVIEAKITVEHIALRSMNTLKGILTGKHHGQGLV